jgi:hypothetical protein
MVPETVSAALKYVAPLKKDKTVAYETVPREDVVENRCHCENVIAAMKALNRLQTPVHDGLIAAVIQSGPSCVDHFVLENQMSGRVA